MGDKTLDHVSELLSSYLDGQASLPERRIVEAHLEECDACRAELAELRVLKGMLAQLPQRQPPRSFVLGPRSLRPSALSGTFGGFLRAATSIAAALAVVAVGLSLVLQGLPRQSVSTAAPSLAAASATAPLPRAALAPGKPAASAPTTGGASSPFAAASPASSLAPAPAAAKPAAAAARPAAQAPAPAGAPASPPSPLSSVAPAATLAKPAAASAPSSGSADSGPPAPEAATPPEARSSQRAAQTRPTASPPPINVPRLAAELLLLLAALGLAAYSIRWWRSSSRKS